jgi:hypothetical protein
MIGIGGRPITRPCVDNAAGRARQAGSHPQISQRLQGIELNRLRPARNQCLMQLAALDIKAGHVGRPSRHNDRAIIFLGQALQPFASVHGIAYGRDDLLVFIYFAVVYASG